MAAAARSRRRSPPLGLGLGASGLVAYFAITLGALLFLLTPHDLAVHLASPLALRALGLTLATTAIATALSAALGTPLAYLLARFSFRGRDIVDTLVDLPITIPPVAAGVALLVAFGRRGWIGRHLDVLGIQIAFTSVAVVMAQLFIASPFFVKAARAGFEAVDPRLENAARTLGASPWRVFWTITVPLAGPALRAGLVLTWARALSEFGATMMFAGNFPGRTQTLPLAVMTALESDLPTAVAVSALSLGLAIVALLLGRRMAGRWSVPLPESALVLDAAVTLGDFRLQVAVSVEKGQTLALVGPSGAGKSTCLALVAGLVPPDTGRIALGEETWCDVARGVDLPPERRGVGMLFQEYALFPHLTVRENVSYGLRRRGRTRAEAGAAADVWLERFGLAGQEERRVGEISGGQRQRVALARAVAPEPRVLLLDEPFGSLDVSTRGAVRSELRSFLAGLDLPTIVVTHDPVDALAFGDRIAVLENGALSQVGSREALLREPRTAFVAELAGLNLYRADVAGGRGLKEGRVGGVVFHVLADDLAGSAFICFAPSEVVLSAERAAGSPQNAFRATVVDVLPLSDRLRLVLDIGVVLAAEITREAAASLDVIAGRTLWAAVKATAIRVYA